MFACSAVVKVIWMLRPSSATTVFGSVGAAGAVAKAACGSATRFMLVARTTAARNMFRNRELALVASASWRAEMRQSRTAAASERVALERR